MKNNQQAELWDTNLDVSRLADGSAESKEALERLFPDKKIRENAEFFIKYWGMKSIMDVYHHCSFVENMVNCYDQQHLPDQSLDEGELKQRNVSFRAISNNRAKLMLGMYASKVKQELGNREAENNLLEPQFTALESSSAKDIAEELKSFSY